MNKEIVIDKKKGASILENEKLYKTLCQTIEKWPDWKKKEYNDNYAIPNYSKELIINDMK